MDADLYSDGTYLIDVPIATPILLCEGADDRLEYVNLEEAALLSIQHFARIDAIMMISGREDLNLRTSAVRVRRSRPD